MYNVDAHIWANIDVWSNIISVHGHNLLQTEIRIINEIDLSLLRVKENNFSRRWFLAHGGEES